MYMTVNTKVCEIIIPSTPLSSINTILQEIYKGVLEPIINYLYIESAVVLWGI